MKGILRRAYWKSRSFANLFTDLLYIKTVNFIDVGSWGGLPYPWDTHSHMINYLLKFEPRDKTERKKRQIVFNTALWEENCEKDFYIYKGFGGSGSSLFHQNVEYVKQNFEELKKRGTAKLASTWFERSELDKVEKIRCRKLDDILREMDYDIEFHFLKVDAQGAEYEMLRGSEDFLSASCLGLHLELFVIPLYEGITLLPEVKRYLEEFGFRLEWKYLPHGTFDCAHDCIFIKRGRSNKIIQTTFDVECS